MLDKSFVVRIPSELFEALETMANITGRSIEDILQEALIEAYGSPHFLLKLAIPKQLQQLQRQLDRPDRQMGTYQSAYHENLY